MLQLHHRAKTETQPASDPRDPVGFFRRRLLRTRQGGAYLVAASALLIHMLTRLALLLRSAGDITWDVSVVQALLWGAVYDVAATVCWTAALGVFLAVLPRNALKRPMGRVAAHVLVFALLHVVMFVAVSEWFFWDEFGSRFNFIAVDYLVYTHEVLGNIRESYDLPLILGVLFAASALVQWALVRSGWIREWIDHSGQGWGLRWRASLYDVAIAVVVVMGLSERDLPAFENNFVREIAKSGVWSFFAAFRSNQLDFDHFYPTLPVSAAMNRVRGLLGAPMARNGAHDEAGISRRITAGEAEIRPNVIQITVESLSASFMQRYGNKDGITPNLDRLAGQSLVFERLYATGNRTDRGMEALSLSVPPTPGRSMIKRPNNEALFTLGSVFRAKGYDTAFIYGGYGYFDNMNHYFGENGYRVVDRNAVGDRDVTFANVWGACDEDLYRWTLREADNDFAAGKPFHYFVMTTSNHRPYTFPSGRIDLESKASGRAGAVKYTDYAIGEFLREASDKPWFRNTIFVIVADHCASSAGRTELPVQNYHIPMMIYAPGGQVPAGSVGTLMSQVDYAPTLLALMHWSYESQFYGNDVLSAFGKSHARAFIANYQKLGLLKEDRLVVLKPVRESSTYKVELDTGEASPVPADPMVLDDAVAYYQTASHLMNVRNRVK